MIALALCIIIFVEPPSVARNAAEEVKKEADESLRIPIEDE